MTAYSLDLSRVDKVSRTYDLAAIFTELSGPFTAASVALLPVGAKPNGSTVFVPMTVANGQATVLYAGPDASSTGAVVVTGSCDPWIEATSGTETQAVRVPGGRITLRGGGSLTALPLSPDQAILAVLNDTTSASYARVEALIAARAGFGGLTP